MRYGVEGAKTALTLLSKEFMKIILLVFLFSFGSASAQHCPWDCTGFLMIKTDASEAEMKSMHPTLVDGRKQIIVDTLYGTGKNTFDTCRFLEYDEFVGLREEKSKIHSFYRHDTMLKFAKGFYVVHFNFCKYDKDKEGPLFISYAGAGHGHDHYIPVPVEKRIHLHNHSNDIYKKNYDAILKNVDSQILTINRKDWGLQ